MSKRDIVELSTLGSIGAAGVSLPRLDQFAEFFTGLTPIVSFFLIVIPTGIWAWCRAIQFIRESFSKKDP